eukprot:178681_1
MAHIPLLKLYYNRCCTTGCYADRHQHKWMKVLSTCSVCHNADDGSHCEHCRGSGYHMVQMECRHCATHCVASSRTSVDLLVELLRTQEILKRYKTRCNAQRNQIEALKAQLKDDHNHPRIMDEKEFKQNTEILSSLTKKLESNHSDCKVRKQIYNIAKQIYKQQHSPVFIRKDIVPNIKKNKNQYQTANALPLTLTMDKDFNTFNKDRFKREFATKMRIPVQAVRIVSVIEGSTIVHTEITAYERDGVKYTVGAIAEKMTEKQATKQLVEFGVFLAEFGEPVDTFKPLKQKMLMNPKWNRVYGPGQVEWSGSLNNDKTEPYYCPRGWTKYTCHVEDTSEQFDKKYETWPVAYHGTKFSLAMMISFSRLRAGGHSGTAKASGVDCFGTGFYFSPSITYAAHPLYAHPKKMSSDAVKYAGKWVQVVLNCRIKPGFWSTHRATIGDRSQPIDPNYDNKKLEWLVHAPQGTYLDESKVVFCGYMIRTSDCDPRQLATSKWWNLDAYGKDKVDGWYE